MNYIIFTSAKKVMLLVVLVWLFIYLFVCQSVRYITVLKKDMNGFEWNFYQRCVGAQGRVKTL